MNTLQLDRALADLQEQTVNNGGSFRFQEFSPKGSSPLNDFLQSLPQEVRLTSLKAQQAKELISQRIDHWSLYEGPSPERKENTAAYESLRGKYMDDLFAFLATKGLIHVYHVENLNFQLNEILSSGRDHLNEDFIFQTAHEVYILHLGFSS